MAINLNHIDTSIYLLIHKADINIPNLYGELPIHLAMNMKNNMVFNLLLDGSKEFIDQLDISNNTPLNNAIFYNNTEAAKLLIDCGAETNIKNHYGFCPLQTALVKKNIEVFRHLINHGADINVTPNTGHSLLYHAIKMEEIDFARLLAEAGAEFNIEDRSSLTPLYHRVMTSNVEAAESPDSTDSDLLSEDNNQEYFSDSELAGETSS
jgi:ankyrin repeat protein